VHRRRVYRAVSILDSQRVLVTSLAVVVGLTVVRIRASDAERVNAGSV